MVICLDMNILSSHLVVRFQWTEAGGAAGVFCHTAVTERSQRRSCLAHRGFSEPAGIVLELVMLHMLKSLNRVRYLSNEL